MQCGSCAGIALGFDRLVLLCTSASRIEDVLRSCQRYFERP
jgi:elongation factor P--beta-lysine ligase